MATASIRSEASGLRVAFRAFRHRPFRLFYFGFGVSLVGTWMQQVAMSWLVYRLTGSAFALGAVGFASQFPSFLAAPLAGVLADRWSRHRMVLGTQALAMVQATLLAALVLTGAVEVWHILALSAVLGVISGFDIPARHALMVDLVEGPEDLANGIALNSSLFNATRLIGPAIAGILIGLVGEGLVFALNAASYVVVIGALLAIGVPPRGARTGGRDVLLHLREGFGYALGFPPIRTLLVLLSLLSLFAMPYVVLLPVFASDVLGGGPQALGFLMSGAGLGALVGALWLAGRNSVRGLSRVMVITAALFGAALIAFSLSRSIWLSVALLLLAGFGLMITTASTNTILQTIVEERMRGRVMSFYTMAFMGLAPVGALFAGGLASSIGAPATVLLGGVATLATAVWFARQRPALRERIRPIYVQLGILPEVAEGMREATELRPKG